LTPSAGGWAHALVTQSETPNPEHASRSTGARAPMSQRQR
jgi:hypothetical protein